MAENLNVYTPSGSRYYNNDSMSYAETYGRLYTWNTAINSCPINWHLPSDEEWMELEVILGMNWVQTFEMGFRGYGIGYKLMETGTLHWEGPNPGATNEVNFNALPAGSYSPEHLFYQFEWLGTKADFLTATDTAYTEVIPFPQYFHRALVNNDGYIGRLLESCFSNAYSVRCVSYPSKPISVQNSYLPNYTLPGKYTYYVTQTISGCESPADTVIFTILSEVSPPEAANISVCENSSVPDLFAEGMNIKWYSNVDLSNLLHSGNSYATGKILPGIYEYYVTQTIGDIESKADKIILTVNPVPNAPATNDVFVCENQPVPDLIATGDNIRWYSDSLLTNPIYTGSIYSSGITQPGIYTYYISQTISCCESEFNIISLSINPSPVINLGKDTTIYQNQSIILGPFNNHYNYTWNNGSHNQSIEIPGNEISIGNHTISVEVTDTNSCSYNDSIDINVVKCYAYGSLKPISCERYTSPGGKVWTVSGAYIDTIPNMEGCDSILSIDLTINSVDTSVSRDESVLIANAVGATYQWIKYDNGYLPIEGEIHQTFAAGENGFYAMIVSQNGCMDTSGIFYVNITGLVFNTFRHNVILYPNPTNGFFTIDLGWVYPEAEVIITDLDGRVIQSDKMINIRLKELQLPEVPGPYLLIITSGNEKASFKVVKK